MKKYEGEMVIFLSNNQVQKVVTFLLVLMKTKETPQSEGHQEDYSQSSSEQNGLE